VGENWYLDGLADGRAESAKGGKVTFEEYQRALHCGHVSFDELARTAWEARAEVERLKVELDEEKRHYRGCDIRLSEVRASLVLMAGLEHTVDMMRPVVEAAVKWRGGRLDGSEFDLIIDAYLAARGEGES
jgi:hypothetical protein